MQPIVVDDDGIHRYKKNPIVCYLLDNGPFDMNAIARLKFEDEDREQFAQLIGYSVSGACDLSYFSDKTCRTALAKSQKLIEKSKENKG